MRELFRDYGAAIGPTLAFVLGLIALAVKRAFDNLAARWDAERRVKKIIEMVSMSPPPSFQGTIAALSHVEDVMTNILNMHTFFDRMAAIKGAIDAAEKPVHEHARPETILAFQKIRLHFETIMNERRFFRKSTSASSDIPIDENFFNIEQSWRGLLDAAKTPEKVPHYRLRTPDGSAGK